MNYNMYPNRMGDNIDPNYIYPQPYIDPLMYMNPYYNNQNMNFNSSPSPNPEYNTYSNQYVDNPQYAQYENIPNQNTEVENQFQNNMNMNPNMNPNMNMNNNGNNIPIIPMMPPNMMYPGMMVPPNMMYPNPMSSMMYPGIMYPGMMMPPNMMYPGPMTNIPTVNMEEFDEEEM